jgi:hypothetical protein
LKNNIEAQSSRPHYKTPTGKDIVLLLMLFFGGGKALVFSKSEAA